MKLAWMLGSSMAQRHLLYVYLTVWIVQGGYCAWIAWQWMHTKPNPTPTSDDHHDV